VAHLLELKPFLQQLQDEEDEGSYAVDWKRQHLKHALSVIPPRPHKRNHSKGKHQEIEDEHHPLPTIKSQLPYDIVSVIKLPKKYSHPFIYLVFIICIIYFGDTNPTIINITIIAYYWQFNNIRDLFYEFPICG
jgi:hypothetical protein